MNVVPLVLALAVTLAGNVDATARGCMVHDHQPLQVRRMPMTPAATSKPRNPLEDEAVHCDATMREGPPGLQASSTEVAPFGLSWGPVTDVPKPSLVDREANLTGLYYFHDRPLASGPDTIQVILMVCREQGLQQVVWVGRALDREAHAIARETLRREGVRLHGNPRPGPFPDSLEWPAGRTLLATRVMPDGTRELVMAASGPDFAACSEAHRTGTGHPAEAHVTDLLAEAVR